MDKTKEQIKMIINTKHCYYSSAYCERSTLAKAARRYLVTAELPLVSSGSSSGSSYSGSVRETQYKRSISNHTSGWNQGRGKKGNETPMMHMIIKNDKCGGKERERVRVRGNVSQKTQDRQKRRQIK